MEDKNMMKVAKGIALTNDEFAIIAEDLYMRILNEHGNRCLKDGDAPRQLFMDLAQARYEISQLDCEALINRLIKARPGMITNYIGGLGGQFIQVHTKATDHLVGCMMRAGAF
jgi:hypothetical protein